MKGIFKLLILITACELIGIINAPITIKAIPLWYQYLNKPPFSPPNWIFGPVWIFLYFLMGLSVYLVLNKRKNPARKKAIFFFIIQLILNFIWTPIFFGLYSAFFGLIDLVLLWIFVFYTIKYFYTISKIASYLLIPYMLWISFALILNLSIFLLN